MVLHCTSQRKPHLLIKCTSTIPAWKLTLSLQTFQLTRILQVSPAFYSHHPLTVVAETKAIAAATHPPKNLRRGISSQQSNYLNAPTVRFTCRWLILYMRYSQKTWYHSDTNLGSGHTKIIVIIVTPLTSVINNQVSVSDWCSIYSPMVCP